ncbi:Oidioi.mRNA.OKI2018_I69.chr1.g114.t1.cds [Oikopleura dioica]|uniref:Oidioi.mRNA.OKI2018_I69.chr1.g114.t1.cds n=1 Tax=Oikopleura dioica TaxID=34765 RepID=A0ABN7SNY6_OIKDI|nr:Oidioi.mRNA.OKI2018_I69.chr1.g114.t1.cds [Oikopleura dioica]
MSYPGNEGSQDPWGASAASPFGSAPSYSFGEQSIYPAEDPVAGSPSWQAPLTPSYAEPAPAYALPPVAPQATSLRDPKPIKPVLKPKKRRREREHRSNDHDDDDEWCCHPFLIVMCMGFTFLGSTIIYGVTTANDYVPPQLGDCVPAYDGYDYDYGGPPNYYGGYGGSPSYYDSGYTSYYLNNVPFDFATSLTNQSSLDSQTVGLCDGDYEYSVSTSGTFQSPNYPNNYGPCSRCTNRFASSSDGITFDLIAFQLEACCDALVFRNEYGAEFMLTGHKQTQTRFSFESAFVDVYFHSDSSRSRSGFSIDVFDGYESNNDINSVYPSLKFTGEIPKKKIHRN